MPEYLAPAVYVEEVDTGSKPIEGVSTSTVGMVGVTERGPTNIPILVTSVGEYRRWFGELLTPRDFGTHCFLPHAVEGFFSNGGKRSYITRVSPSAAAQAERLLFRQQATTPTTSRLIGRALRGDTTIVVLRSAPVFDTAVTVASPWLRIGDGGDADYAQASGPAVAAAAPWLVQALSQPLSRNFSGTVAVEDRLAAFGAAGATFTLTEAAPAGTNILRLNATAAVIAGQVVQLGAGSEEELLIVRSVAGPLTNLSVTLEAPTQVAHPNAAAGAMFAMWAAAPPTTTTTRPTQAGDGLLTGLGAIIPAGNLVVIRAAAPSTWVEVRRAATLRRASLGLGAYASYPAGTRLEELTTVDVGTVLNLAADIPAGSSSITLDDRRNIVAGTTVLRIGGAADPTVEYVRVREVPNAAPAGWAGPDPGRVVLDWPLARPHAAGLFVARQTLTAVAAETAALALDTDAGSPHLFFALMTAAWPGAFAGRVLRVTTPQGATYHHRVDNAGTADFQRLDFAVPLALPHGILSGVSTASPLLDVVALDAGAWGNRLAASARQQSPAMIRTTVRTRTGAAMRLQSSSGIEVGTVLQAFDAAGNPDPTLFKITAIDRQNGNELTFNVAPPVVAAVGARIESVEFQLDVLLYRQPDPSQPTRDDQVIDSESFRNLSLDPRHSRYIHQIVGTTWTPGAPGDLDDGGRPLRKVDRRSEGESQYVRIWDRAWDLIPIATRDAELASIRLGPDLLIDTLPDGRQRPSRLRLSQGDDQIASLIADDYVGVDAAEPINRTGLQTLRNIEDISIVAVPGATSAQIQNAVINHCELMRYRFAVLDGAPPPGDTIANVQLQRAQYDTKYAALYHPWLMIPHPYPSAPGAVEDYAIPPSGHMLGIYARTDIERGVHKAPANEVVRGVIGLRRTLNKEHHDILNPYPVNINVIRDFRPNNRGIRVYGGRVITSDSDWKYVNVRRLLIFIEASVDRGLQWVVFEPNAEPLWARVRRSISNFLTVVWRNGALEGTSVEEAFFVKCDRTTMTQTDIDSGRLIVQVGVAPVKPAEFVIVRIGLWTAHAED